jgi:hypothetical protein
MVGSLDSVLVAIVGSESLLGSLPLVELGMSVVLVELDVAPLVLDDVSSPELELDPVSELLPTAVVSEPCSVVTAPLDPSELVGGPSLLELVSAPGPLPSDVDSSLVAGVLSPSPKQPEPIAAKKLQPTHLAMFIRIPTSITRCIGTRRQSAPMNV